MIDLEAVRRDTPSTETWAHLNNAGASPMPDTVKQAVIACLNRESEIGGYGAETELASGLNDFYDAFGALLGCNRSEIAYVENATRAWDMAFYAIDFQPGDRIITCTSEYASNYLALLHVARTRGAVIDVAPDDASGQVSVAGLADMIRPQTRLIAVTHVPTHGGLVNPAAAIGQVAKAHGVLYLLDACQSVGQMAVDIRELGCDMLAGTGRKFLRGPRGTGFLYVRGELIEALHPPFIDLHAARWTGPNSYELRSDARRFETWESNVAGKIGLARAVRYALDLGLSAISERVSLLAEGLRERLAALPNVQVADQGTTKCAIVTFSKRGEHATVTRDRLAAHGIMASVAVRESALLDFQARNLQSLVRLSVHYFNTEREIEKACAVIAD